MKRVLIAAPLILLLGVAIAIFSQPDHFTVTRVVQVRARTPAAFAAVNSLHTWPAWTQWGALDRVPGSDLLEGPPEGVGARWTWQRKGKGDRQGLEIIKATDGTQVAQVVFKVVGESPAQPTMTFDLTPGSVRATFEGKLELMGKAVSLVKGPEAVIGPTLERELATLAQRLSGP